MERLGVGQECVVAPLALVSQRVHGGAREDQDSEGKQRRVQRETKKMGEPARPGRLDQPRARNNTAPAPSQPRTTHFAGMSKEDAMKNYIGLIEKDDPNWESHDVLKNFSA